MPCASLGLALEGAEYLNSTTVIVEQCQPAGNTTSNVCTVISEPEATSNITECPPWMYPNGTACECGASLDRRVICDPALQHVLLNHHQCMTYRQFTQNLVVGACPYYANPRRNEVIAPLHGVLPTNASEVEEAVCGYYNRRGQLCGECKEGYSPAVYSYDLGCKKCTHSPLDWVKYILAAFLPLTVFLVLVFILRIRASSPRLKMFIIICQTATTPVFARHIISTYSSAAIHEQVYVRILVAVFGIWNLDFFRTLPPTICLNVSTREAMAMDYLAAFYPLVLTILLYALIELHDRGCKLVTCLWKPFHKCSVHFRKTWDIRTSTIDAFVTLFLLSYSKIFVVSMDLLIPTQLYNIKGEEVGTLYSYSDATVELYSKDQIAITAAILTILLCFTVLPVVLLIVYPTKCFQKCFGRCHRRRQQAVHIFMSAFNGYYKDGTEGTWDCRYFAAVDLVVRIIPPLLFVTTQNAMFFGLAVFPLLILATSVILINPYKKQYGRYNIVDTVLIHLTVLFLTSISSEYLSLVIDHERYKLLFRIVLLILALIPIGYILAIIVHWLFSQTWMQNLGCTKWLLRHSCCKKRNLESAAEQEDTELNDLPDRVNHPNDYIDTNSTSKQQSMQATY